MKALIGRRQYHQYIHITKNVLFNTLCSPILHYKDNHIIYFKSLSSISSKSFFSSKTISQHSQLYDPFYIYGTRSVKKNETKRILICGDGDLSYGASLALGFAEENNGDERNNDVELIVSVLESKEVHNQVYKDSKRNIQIIKECGHEVMFEVDATKLQSYFCHEDITFDRIQFNFPHWKGKQNNRLNRYVIRINFAIQWGRDIEDFEQ